MVTVKGDTVLKAYEINPALLFVHLMTIGLITGIFYGKTEKYKRLETDYGILQKENSYLKKAGAKFCSSSGDSALSVMR